MSDLQKEKLSNNCKEKLTGSIDDVTFQEIENRMANATSYEELNDAANLIKDSFLRLAVTELLNDCENDGEEVETAYSLVAGDILDTYLDEENVECLNESRTHRKLHKGDKFKNAVGTILTIRDVDNEHLLDGEPQVTYEFSNSKTVNCHKESSVNSIINDNHYEKLDESKKLNEKFFNLYKDFDSLYGISKYNPKELKDFILDLKRLKRISDKDVEIMLNFANKYQQLIDETGYESKLQEDTIKSYPMNKENIKVLSQYNNKMKELLDKYEKDEITEKEYNKQIKELKAWYENSLTESKLQEDQNETGRRRGVSTIRRIAEMEYFDNQQWYENHMKDYLDATDFVDKEIDEIAKEYNLRDVEAEKVCKQIYYWLVSDIKDNRMPNPSNEINIKESKKIIEEKEYSEEEKFRYALLDRLRSDCEYFLKNGNRFEGHLWAHSVDRQIAKMKELWNSLEDKPEWLSMEDIENYEKEMKQENVNESVKEPSLEITVSRAFDSANGNVPNTIKFNNKIYRYETIMDNNLTPNVSEVVYYTGSNKANTSDDYFYVTYTLNKVGEHSYKGVEKLIDIIDCTDGNPVMTEKKDCTKEVKEKLIEGTSQWTDITEDDIKLFMNTWGNYNENGADADEVNGGWMSLDQAEQWYEEHKEEECFINDTDFPEQLQLEITENTSVTEAIRMLREFIECEDQEALNAIIEATGYTFDECKEMIDDGSYMYLSGVDNDYDLGKTYIDDVYGEDHLADLGRDELLKHIDEKEWAEEIETSLRDQMDDEPSEEMIQGLLDEEIETADAETLALHFDYESYGRDMDFSGWTFVSTGAIQTF